MRKSRIKLGVVMVASALSASASGKGPAMVVVKETDVMREEPAPHGNHGMSTAYRISDAVPQRAMEFRKRTLHVGSSIGLHVLSHDEVYYVLDGHGEVESDGVKQRVTSGTAAYLYKGANVGIRQLGEKPLTIIVAYPVLPPLP